MEDGQYLRKHLIKPYAPESVKKSFESYLEKSPGDRDWGLAEYEINEALNLPDNLAKENNRLYKKFEELYDNYFTAVRAKRKAEGEDTDSGIEYYELMEAYYRTHAPEKLIEILKSDGWFNEYIVTVEQASRIASEEEQMYLDVYHPKSKRVEFVFICEEETSTSIEYIFEAIVDGIKSPHKVYIDKKSGWAHTGR